MSYLTLSNVSKLYKTGEIEVKALSDISFELNDGEFVVVLGSSGAGKTTLLNLLGGMDNATEGEIVLDGKNVTALNKRGLTEYRRNDVGFVFQFYNLMPNLTAKENVEIAVEICKDHLDPVEVLKEVGLDERTQNFPAQLSGGEQQRVSIARAIAKNPKLLLCDEPTGALDSRSATVMLEIMEMMNRSLGATIMMVTHDAFAASYTHRVLFIKDGTVFNELRRGDETCDQFFARIMEVVAFLGGEAGHVS